LIQTNSARQKSAGFLPTSVVEEPPLSRSSREGREQPVGVEGMRCLVTQVCLRKDQVVRQIVCTLNDILVPDFSNNAPERVPLQRNLAIRIHGGNDISQKIVAEVGSSSVGQGFCDHLPHQVPHISCFLTETVDHGYAIAREVIFKIQFSSVKTLLADQPSPGIVREAINLASRIDNRLQLAGL
jgi:hypothetical protein